MDTEPSRSCLAMATSLPGAVCEPGPGGVASGWCWATVGDKSTVGSSAPATSRARVIPAGGWLPAGSTVVHIPGWQPQRPGRGSVAGTVFFHTPLHSPGQWALRPALARVTHLVTVSLLAWEGPPGLCRLHHQSGIKRTVCGSLSIT